MELRKKKGRENTPGGRKEGKVWASSRERATESFVLRAFPSFQKAGSLGEVPGEDLNRILISFPDVSPQGCGLYRLVGTKERGHQSMQLILMSIMVSLYLGFLLLFWAMS